ncbi:TPA: antitoxin [Enterococcus faecium]
MYSILHRIMDLTLNHELDTKNTRLLEVNLLNQLEVAQEVDLFQQPFEELQAIHEYWRSMNQYSKQILNKEKVA